MKKALWLIPVVLALVIGGRIEAAGPFPTALGGLGTSTLPQAGQVPIGVSSTSYTPAYILCAGGCTVATSSGGITITAASSSAILTNTGNWAGTWQGVNSSTLYSASNPSSYISGITLNSFVGTIYNILGTGNVTTSVSNGSTTISLINSGVPSGTYNWANLTVSSSGVVTAASSNGTPVTSLTGTPHQVSVSSSTGAVTLSTPQNIDTNSTVQFAQLTTTGQINTNTLNVSSTATFEGIFTQSGGAVSLASTTINGNATGTSLALSGNLSIATTTAPTAPSVALVNGDTQINGNVWNWFWNSSSTSPTTTVTFSGVADHQAITLTIATTTIYLAGLPTPPYGALDLLKVCQDGTGSRTVTWAASSTNVSTTIDWGNAGTPTLSTGANKCDIYSFLTSPKSNNRSSSAVDGEYGANGFTN